MSSTIYILIALFYKFVMTQPGLARTKKSYHKDHREHKDFKRINPSLCPLCPLW